jgi:acetyl-CoA acetyltransferase
MYEKPDELLREPYVVAPLRAHDIPAVVDGAAAMVLVAGELARKAPHAVWVRGIDQRIEAHSPGARDLTRSESTRLAAKNAGVFDKPVDVVEMHAPFSHQELILGEALGVDENVRVNPSGGALGANPVMVAGLLRIGEAAGQIYQGKARRAVAHATSGPCLQQNLVCVLEGGAQ